MGGAELGGFDRRKKTKSTKEKVLDLNYLTFRQELADNIWGRPYDGPVRNTKVKDGHQQEPDQL